MSDEIQELQEQVARWMHRTEKAEAQVERLQKELDVTEYVKRVEHFQSQRDAIRAKLDTVTNAECGTCGRSLPPDGDCYGCQADRLQGKVRELEQEIEDWKAATGLVDGKGDPVGITPDMLRYWFKG